MCTSEEELYDERNSRYATHNLVEMPFDCLTSYPYTYVYAFSSRRQTLAIYHPEQAAERRCAFNTTLTSSQSIEASAPVVMIKTARLGPACLLANHGHTWSRADRSSW